ncbi:MAG: PHP domain-containing protein [Clostridia bacterium]|nr:PHP domain-containing protein [Clostridia bacterium]
MSDYLFEMHFHTDESSGCGKIPAAEGVELYIEKGYDGIVVTDHFQMYRVNTEAEYLEYAKQQKEGYEAALKAANGRIKILRGMEYRPRGTDNDYLVYGVTDEFVFSHPELKDTDFRQFSTLAHENGLIVFQAHPFRNHMTVTPPDLLDGIEVYNGNRRHNSRNLIAQAWADMHGMRKISGSDFHQTEDLATGGTIFTKEINDEKELIAELMNGIYGQKTMPLER